MPEMIADLFSYRELQAALSQAQGVWKITTQVVWKVTTKVVMITAPDQDSADCACHSM